ncbi:hypothetical protein G9F32_09160 [Acinetobacter sp. 194]|uniref:hypothetical protein n=1 Tax=Acinetobacter shaoyimingii TaxID=2715164 RepID=UPI00140B0A39|nr:hypothetical protein [Acinetobacter shaoyimingii]NHB58186.1 hypothetical protein [Acinetobacter shaoyimingii]
MKKTFYVLCLVCVLTGCQDKSHDSTEAVSVEPTEKDLSSSNIPVAHSDQGEIEDLTVSDKNAIYPKQVLEFIQLRLQHCSAHKQLQLEKLIKVANIWGDDQPEYILEPHLIRCDDHASSHNDVRQISIFATLEGGVTKRIFDHPMLDYALLESKTAVANLKNETTKVQDPKLFDQQYRNSQKLINDQTSSNAKDSEPKDLTVKYPKQELWLTVGGAFCGQDMTQVSRAEAITCKRLVVWDAKLRELRLDQMKVNVMNSQNIQDDDQNNLR